MNDRELESFPPEVVSKLKTYVYRLIDPRNGETFYVGKGKGNRVFAHIRAEKNFDGDEIVCRYCAEPVVFQHKALLISVNRSAAETSLYEATRYAWKVSRTKAKQAEVILATRQGLIVGAFVADDWLDATASDFPGHEDAPGRLAFVGREAPDRFKKLYVGKRVPDEYRKPGAANPIKYTW
jgi:uncharacterized protein